MTAVLRIIRFTFQNVGRNLWLTLATLAVLTLTLVSVNLLIAVNYLGGVAASAVEDRVDLAVHFKPGVEEARVRTVQSALLGLSETKDVRYVSPEEGAAEFAEAYADDPEISAAIAEVGENPFGPALVIKARELDGYQRIRDALSDPAFTPLIDGQNFDDGQAVVASVRHWAERATSVALAVSVAFVIITAFIVYTTVRMSIATHRDEIGIMRLVGAPDSFIRGPFYGEAVVWTICATFVTGALVWVGATFATPWLQRFFATTAKVDLIGFYAEHAILAVLGQILAVLVLTLAATRIATSRYIRV